MEGKEPRYLIGSKPVNRRTAPKDTEVRAKSPVVLARLQHRQLRNRLGAPLADLLRQDRGHTDRLSTGTIVASMLAAGASVGIFLGWLHGSPLAAGASVATLLGAVLLAVKSTSRRRAEPVASTLLEARNVAAFDTAIAALEGRVVPELVSSLSDLKQQLARMASSPAAGATNEHFTVEDRLYLNECVRRYIPDTLEAYLSVNAAVRAEAAEGQVGLQMALEQLALLRTELDRREQKLVRSATESLHRQQRFLQAKSSVEP